MVEELGQLEPRLKVESYNFVLDKEKAESLGIRRIPAIAVMGESKDYGIRLYGLPTGYEFGTFIDAILDVSQGDSQLSRRDPSGPRRPREARPHPGLLHPHLTPLPPGRAPGLPLRPRKRQGDRGRRRGHGLSAIWPGGTTSPPCPRPWSAKWPSSWGRDPNPCFSRPSRTPPRTAAASSSDHRPDRPVPQPRALHRRLPGLMALVDGAGPRLRPPASTEAVRRSQPYQLQLLFHGLTAPGFLFASGFVAGLPRAPLAPRAALAARAPAPLRARGGLRLHLPYFSLRQDGARPRPPRRPPSSPATRCR